MTAGSDFDPVTQKLAEPPPRKNRELDNVVSSLADVAYVAEVANVARDTPPGYSDTPDHFLDEADNVQQAFRLCRVWAEPGQRQACVLPGHRGQASIVPDGLWYACECGEKPLRLEIRDLYATLQHGRIVRLLKHDEEGQAHTNRVLVALWSKRMEAQLGRLALPVPEIVSLGSQARRGQALVMGFSLLSSIRESGGHEPPFEYSQEFAAAWCRPWCDMPPRVAGREIQRLVEHGYLERIDVQGAGRVRYRYRLAAKAIVEETPQQGGNDGSDETLSRLLQEEAGRKLSGRSARKGRTQAYLRDVR